MPCIEMKGGQLPTGLRAYDQYQVYNILDSAITSQLVPAMLEHANENHLTTYHRTMEMQSLCLDMSRKGFPVNQMELANLIYELDRDARKALKILQRYANAVYCPFLNGEPKTKTGLVNRKALIDVGGVSIPAPFLNPGSWQQVGAFFYDVLNYPVVWQYDHKTKQRKRGTDRDALEKLRDSYPSAVPFVNAILAYREAVKLAGVFKKGLEPGTSRLRCNFSPTGTETGRLSSQTNPFQRGTNAQNLNDRVRRVIEAPPGFLLAYPDLKTGESYAVGFLARDRAYIEACSSGDLHTRVSALVWRDLGWTGVLAKDKKIAEQIFYRDFSYRDLAKKGGHGTNYYGKPPTMAKHLKVDKRLVEAFQADYFAAFPGIPQWHLEIIARIQQEGIIITPMRRERMFWGRKDDEATWREAIAHGPQSLVADVENEGLKQVQDWLIRECDYRHIMAQVDGGTLAQIHDAGMFLIPIDGHEQILPEIQKRQIYPIDFGQLGVMEIPVDMSVGKNWGKWKEGKNPEGIKGWKPGQRLHFG